MKETKRMSAAQRRARQRKLRNRRIAMTVALVLVVALASIGGTIAWLTATTATVTNTFTASNIDITLTETWNTDTDDDGENDSWSAKMVPGNTITKDPKVTVVAGSEDCWLFVKVEKSTNLDNFISYTVVSDWTALDGVDGVYYRKVNASNTNQEFSVLANNQVTVKDTVTKDMMDGLSTNNQPTLKFTAYACQSANLSDLNNDTVIDAKDAWEAAKPAVTP